MFELPPGECGGWELYERLPIVRLPDAEEDVCVLLDTLRNPLPLYEKNLPSEVRSI